MSASGQKVPKAEVEEVVKEKGNETPTSSLIPNMSSVRSATSASTSKPASTPIPMTQAPPTDPASAFIDHELREMKEEFFQMKKELLQTKEKLRETKENLCWSEHKVAKLMSAFDWKTKKLEDSLHKIQTQLTIQTSFLNTIPPQDAPTVNQCLPRIPLLPKQIPYRPLAPFMPQQPMSGSIPPCFPTLFNAQTPSFDPMPVKRNSPIENKQPVPIIKKVQCVLCHASTHGLWNCTTFITVVERRAVMRKQNKCPKCLQPLGDARIMVHPDCMILSDCEFCMGKDHRSLFCENREQKANKIPADKAVPAGTLRYAPY